MAQKKKGRREEEKKIDRFSSLVVSREPGIKWLASNFTDLSPVD